MDDWNRQINEILSDPQSMRQIQEMAAALGLGGAQNAAPQSAAPEPPPPPPPPSQPQAGPLTALGGLSPEALQTVGRIAPLLGQLGKDDDATRLLKALRPLLSPSRQKKLDEAVKILQMMRLLPLLKGSGLF